MRFAASITNVTDTGQAVRELLEPLAARLTPGMVDLALLFVTAHFEEDIPEIVERIGAAVPGAVLLGCTAEATIGVDRELERTPSMALVVATMPDVCIRPFHMSQGVLNAARTGADWERIVAVAPESHPVFIALGDPFQFDIHGFVDGINERYPGAPLIGGIASAGRRPGENRLIVNGDIKREGLVGVGLTGCLEVRTVVSQGCRPIGKPLVITKSDRNVVQELGGKPALVQLHDVLVSLSKEDEALAKQSLFIGTVIDEYKENFARGDFLIHNILGVDRRNGAIGIAANARVGSTVQFHVRDAASADSDLRELLAPHADRKVDGAMLFGCNGRGTNMWPTAGHDIGVFRQCLGDVPVAGFFCGGEFGPIGGRNFVHGFTASIALFSRLERPDADEGDRIP